MVVIQLNTAAVTEFQMRCYTCILREVRQCKVERDEVQKKLHKSQS